MSTSSWKDLSSCIRVYVQGESWVRIQPYPRPVGSHRYAQIPSEISFGSKRSSACWRIGFLHRNASINIWCICHLSRSVICSSWSIFKRSSGACLSLLYTSNRHFNKLCHLAILSGDTQPWPMTKVINFCYTQESFCCFFLKCIYFCIFQLCRMIVGPQ